MADKKEEKKKAKNLDDILGQMAAEHSKDLDASFKAVDAFNKDENQMHLYNNILTPGQDALYNTLVSSLDKEFEKKDETKLEKKEQHDKVRKAVNKALRSYFEKTQPHVVKAMDDLKMSEDDQYQHLSSLYDEHTGGDPRNKQNHGIRAIVESLIRQKKTVGHVKQLIYNTKSAGAQGALEKLNDKYQAHHFGKYNNTQVAAYLKPKFEKEGYEIEDKLGYIQSDLDTLMKMRSSVIEKEGHQYLSKKKEEKKK
ncbi:MAG: hypothetical protein AABX04_05625 [Nanoarchaeota archaeon]